MTHALTLSQETKICHLASPFVLESGEILEGAVLGFEEYGPKQAPVVIALGGISAGRDLRWWDFLIGPGHAVDTRSYRVLGVDYLGGVDVSSGPKNSGLGEKFPVVSSKDQARVLAQLLDTIAVEKVQCLIGASYGGMVGLAFAELFPEKIEKLIVISAAHESHPLATGWRSVQRKILELGLQSGFKKESVALARALAMTTYRSPEELALRFSAAPKAGRFPIEDYLESRGVAFSERFDANSYLRLSLAIDLHRVTPENIQTPTDLIAVDSDQLVPVSQMRELARRLRGPVRLREVHSIYGHDAFLKEESILSEAIAQVLKGGL